MRRIVQNLTPYQLSRAGLTKTLKSMIERVEAATGIICEADIAPLDGLFDHEGEVNLYRIVQESLNNVVKHSGATQVQVRATTAEKGLKLTITDDGCGFAVADTLRAETVGLGLCGMIERAKMLGGECEIISWPNTGTKLQIIVPFH